MRFTLSKCHNVTKTFDKQILLVNPSRITADTSAEMLSPHASTTSGHHLFPKHCAILSGCVTALIIILSRLPHAQYLPHTAQTGKDRAVNRQRPLFNYKLLPSRWNSSSFLARNYHPHPRVCHTNLSHFKSPLPEPAATRGARHRRQTCTEARGLQGPGAGAGQDQAGLAAGPAELSAYRQLCHHKPRRVKFTVLKTGVTSKRHLLRGRWVNCFTMTEQPATRGVPGAVGWNHTHALITENTVIEEEMGNPLV